MVSCSKSQFSNEPRVQDSILTTLVVPNSDRCRLKPGAIPKFQGNYLKENNDHNYSKLHVDKRALKLNRMKNSVRSLKQMGQFLN